ncbi:hypothetical protein AJ78_00198 [Emergomyces pasteurianus Ep9510]|uniref:C3H1-type domain-containing protein n=1 Tax=Emergomyces pasteurianus Ep9510 TaxID=1447872 RepID=A0A1J9QUF8_9EURO|nr:hypothetical protein AJ78_00198 [Emergomyces pasteurianus Ep9510]
MQFTEEQAAEVKGWVVKRLEDISDADSDVLADYVLALIRSDAPDEDIRKASVENLEDFLKENTADFVDEIFARYNPKKPTTVHAKGQPSLQQPPEPNAAAAVAAATHPVAPLQSQPHPPHSTPFTQLQPMMTPESMSMTPFGHGHGRTAVNPSQPNRGGFEGAGTSNNFSRKRAFNEGPHAGEEYDSHYSRADRPFKSMRGRRGGGAGGAGGGRGDNRMVANSNNNNNNMGVARMGSAHTGLSHLNHQQQHKQQGFQGMPSVAPPAPPAGFPPFNPNDPIAAMMALQAMGFPQIPGIPMPPLPQIPNPTGGATGPNNQPSAAVGGGSPPPPPASIPQRCRDYDTQGFCVLGSTCPYQHGTDHLVAPARDDEYDPTKSNIVMDRPRSSSATNGQSSAGPSSRGGERGGRGRGRGRGDRGGFTGSRRNRADFSHIGPNEDKSITTIVVEQIPEDKFDENTVRDFFSEFGNIVEVTMQPYKHLALVKYDTWAAARSAWSSTKAIFDNRFVKVYWYKPGSKAETNGAGSHPPHHPPGHNKPGEKPFDQEEFEKQQAEAQRVHEEKMKKRKETEEARLALEKQKEDLLKRQQEEQAKLLQRLGSHHPETTAPTTATTHTTPDGTNGTSPATADSETTKSLRAQLAALEAEAKSLGLDPALSDSQYAPRGRGRGWGGYRGGRGTFAPRGRGGYDPSFRGGGAYRGRGAAPPRGRGGVLRLDNRPRRVAVSGVEFTPERDEALRQFLLGVGEYENIEPNPDQPDSQIVSFKDRYIAEKLMYGPTDIPSVGKVEFSWVANAPSAPGTRDGSVSAPPLMQQQGGQAATKENEDAHMGNNGTHETDPMLRKDAGGHHEVDYDVAEIDDTWAVE